MKKKCKMIISGLNSVSWVLGPVLRYFEVYMLSHSIF